jgi:hypothetical protein
MKSQKEILGNKLRSSEFENPEEEFLRKERELRFITSFKSLTKKIP